MNRLGRWWAIVGGAPMRALARRLSAQLPQASHEGIDLVVGDSALVQEAEQFFERAKQALDYAAARAPVGYKRLRKDVRSIVLRSETTSPPYNRFQLAIIVPARVALEADAQTYATWLLYASGLSRGGREAANRSSEILRTLDPAEQDEVRAWLPSARG